VDAEVSGDYIHSRTCSCLSSGFSCLYLSRSSGRFVARLGLGGGGGGFVEGYWLDGDGDWVDDETVTVW
jgi:hypothetical protein